MPAADDHPALVHWMGLADANSAGYVHGGTIMKFCDEAAALAAIRHSRCRVVTATVDRMTFLVPVHVAELVTFRAAVNAVWKTSMEVGVRVEAENPRTGEVRHTNSAYLTIAEAQVRRANRLAERDALRAAREAEERQA
jgi:acyl-CoA hydrolase